jgi:hypothetical protein
MDSSPEDERPHEKSSVKNDMNALMVRTVVFILRQCILTSVVESAAKFEKHDKVHMPLRISGRRVKGVFTIHDRRVNKKGAYVEYQLRSTSTMELHENGAWVRERELNEGS